MAVTNIDKHLGHRIAEARKELGLTREQLADLIDSDAAQIEAMEDGTVRITSIFMARISRNVDKPLSWFFDGLPGQDVFEVQASGKRLI